MRVKSIQKIQLKEFFVNSKAIERPIKKNLESIVENYSTKYNELEENIKATMKRLDTNKNKNRSKQSNNRQEIITRRS